MGNLNRREFMKGIVAALAVSSIETAENLETKEFPSPGAISETFKKLLEGIEGKIVRKFEDEKGIIACDIEFVLPDGETALLEYMRKGRHDVMGGSSSQRTNIYVTYFDEGVPVGGTNVAEYRNGQWDIVNGVDG